MDFNSWNRESKTPPREFAKMLPAPTAASLESTILNREFGSVLLDPGPVSFQKRISHSIFRCMKLPSHQYSIFPLLASLTLSLGSVLANPVPNPAVGDIFLGVRATGGDGGSVSYLINLGSDTIYRTAAAGSSFTVSGLGNLGADLTGTYGSNWHSRDDVLWGIFGVRNGVSPVVYGSKARPVPATVSAAWPSLSDTSRSTVASAVASVLEEVRGYKGSEATANATKATFQENRAEASSFAQQVGTAGTSDFSSLSLWTSIEGISATGIASTALDLYRISGTGVTRPGTFTISSAGVISFTAPSAPGPVDSDGDGFTDAQEVYAGTNPSNAGDFFRVAVITVSAAGVRVQSPAAASRIYTIQYSPDPGTPWQNIGTHVAGAGATPVDFTDTDPARLALGKGFYRVRIQ